MQVEHHADFLHGLEDGVVHLIRLNPAFRVGRHAARVRFDSDDPGLVRRAHLFRGEVRREVERHEIINGRVDRLQLGLVRERHGCRRHGRFQIRLALTSASLQIARARSDAPTMTYASAKPPWRTWGVTRDDSGGCRRCT
jgi:hypothetical protein